MGEETKHTFHNGSALLPTSNHFLLIVLLCDSSCRKMLLHPRAAPRCVRSHVAVEMGCAQGTNIDLTLKVILNQSYYRANVVGHLQIHCCLLHLRLRPTNTKRRVQEWGVDGPKRDVNKNSCLCRLVEITDRLIFI